MRVNVETNLRESGVDWLGKIPIDWQVHLFSQTIDRISTGLNPRENFSLNEGGHLYYVTIANFKANKLMLDEACDRIDERAWTLIQERSRLQVGDVLFASIAREGQAYIVREFPENWNINESVFSIRPNKRYFDSEYLYYHLTCSRFFDRLLLEATGSTFKSIKQEMLRNALVVVPPLSVQRQIVAYLNDKTAVIDSRVTVLEQKLSAYKRLKASVINRAVTRGLDPKAKMKDSGVDWIGKIPAGWEARNLTHCCRFFKGLEITKADLTETGTAVISYGQIHSKLNVGTHLKPELLRCVPEAIANADPGSRLKVGDIVFADTSEDVEGCGNCVLMDADVPVYAGYHAIVARPDEPGRSRYFSYLFNAPCWRSQIRSKVAGIKVFSITQRIFKGVSVLLPSESDANAIADYLDAECAKIDKMAELVTREIELYKKLKRSLINEVVTGKREVA